MTSMRAKRASKPRGLRERLAFRDHVTVVCMVQISRRGSIWVDIRSKGLPFLPGKLQLSNRQAHQVGSALLALLRRRAGKAA